MRNIVTYWLFALLGTTERCDVKENVEGGLSTEWTIQSQEHAQQQPKVRVRAHNTPVISVESGCLVVLVSAPHTVSNSHSQLQCIIICQPAANRLISWFSLCLTLTVLAAWPWTLFHTRHSAQHTTHWQQHTVTHMSWQHCHCHPHCWGQGRSILAGSKAKGA